MNLLIILESFFSFFSQFYDFGQERNHLNHQYISNKGVIIVVLLSRFSSLISTYHTLKSFKEKRTFVGGFSTFCLESFGTTTENFKFGFVVASYEVSKKWSVFAVLIKSRAFFIEPIAFCQYVIIIL